MPTPNASPAEGPAWPPTLAVCGWPGSGKTSLIEAFLREEAVRGLRVAVVKHGAHRLEIDHPGKDSDRLFCAGADVVACDAGQGLVRAHDRDQEPTAWLGRLGRGYDLVLAEGHKQSSLPKVWLTETPDRPPPDGVGDVLAVLAGDDRTPAKLRAVVQDFLAGFHQRLPVWAAVLAGGRSDRMGRPKALLPLNGKPLVVHVAHVAAAVAANVVLVGHGPIPDECASWSRLADVPDVAGPLGGMLAAMRWRPDVRWLVLACDLPMARAEAAKWLLAQCAPGRWTVAPHLSDAQRLEPLFAVYDPPAAELLEAGARRGERSLTRILGAPQVFSPRPPARLCDAWTNVNTPEEWRRATS